MRRIKVPEADAALLREELKDLPGVVVKEEAGEVFVEHDADADGERVDVRLRGHLLRLLLRELNQINFSGINFTSTMLLPAHRAECEKLRWAMERQHQLVIGLLRGLLMR